MMRLIDADALEKDYRSQFESVYKHKRDSVNPSDFYIERKAAYDKELMRFEMEAFCKFLQGRPTIEAEPVRHGKWIPYPNENWMKCSACGMEYPKLKMPKTVGYCPNPSCGAKMDLEG